jgi:hypothetical protein
MAKATSAAKFEAMDTGHIVARVCLSMTFFMRDWRGHEAKIVQAYQRVRPILDENIRWYRTAAMRSMGKVKKDTLDAPLVIKQAPPPVRVPYTLTLTSGKTADDVGPVTFYLALIDTATERAASAFHLALPLDWAKDPGRFRQLFVDLAELLPFRSGLAGYATQIDEGEASRPADEACRRWLRQYYGIDSIDVIDVSEDVLSKAKGVNWLTAIDKSFARKLGVDKLRRQLPARVQMHPVGDAVILQAGPEPLLLDQYKDEDTSLYAAVDAAIRPVRLSRSILPGFNDAEETAEWLARFE